MSRGATISTPAERHVIFFHTFCKPLFVKEVGPLHLEVADVIDCKCTHEKKNLVCDFLSRMQLLVKKRETQGNIKHYAE